MNAAPASEGAPEDWTFIALGSNLGDSRAIVARAMDALGRFSDRPLIQSSLWRSDPVDCPPGSAPFINAVVGLLARFEETPETLLAKLQALETEFGRQPRKLLNEPRPLDLDLLTFGRVTCATDRLVLPHPRAHQRRFVLAPLAEVAPDLVLPHQHRTVRDLLTALSAEQTVTRD